MAFEPSLSSPRDGTVQAKRNNPANLLRDKEDRPRLSYWGTTINVNSALKKIGEGPYDTFIVFAMSFDSVGCRVKFLSRKLPLKPKEALRALIKYMRYTVAGKSQMRKDLVICHGGPQLYWTGITEENNVQIAVGEKKEGESYPNTIDGFFDFLYRDDLSKRPRRYSDK